MARMKKRRMEDLVTSEEIEALGLQIQCAHKFADECVERIDSVIHRIKYYGESAQLHDIELIKDILKDLKRVLE